MFRLFLVASLLLTALSSAAAAQSRRPSHCIAIAESAPGLSFIQDASFEAPVPQDTVRITYIDHSMLLIQTEGGLSVVTDYAGYLGTSEFVPDVVTMNNAHDSHWTAFPDPDIPYVLKGWPRDGVAAAHYLDLGEMLIRNVPTDIRNRFGGEPIRDGNSIFVFEVAGLCIGHLGHLHQEPNAEQYAALGRLDVVMAAVDGGLTLDIATMTRVLKRLRASVVIPMHWFGRTTLDRFLLAMSDSFDIQSTGESALEVSLRSLPSRPTVLVLEPRFLPEYQE